MRKRRLKKWTRGFIACSMVRVKNCQIHQLVKFSVNNCELAASQPEACVKSFFHIESTFNTFFLSLSLVKYQNASIPQKTLLSSILEIVVLQVGSSGSHRHSNVLNSNTQTGYCTTGEVVNFLLCSTAQHQLGHVFQVVSHK